MCAFFYFESSKHSDDTQETQLTFGCIFECGWILIDQHTIQILPNYPHWNYVVFPVGYIQTCITHNQATLSQHWTYVRYRPTTSHSLSLAIGLTSIALTCKCVEGNGTGKGEARCLSQVVKMSGTRKWCVPYTTKALVNISANRRSRNAVSAAYWSQN